MSATKVIIIIILLTIILAFRFHQFYQNNPPYYDGQYLSAVITLQQEPDFSYKGLKFTFKSPTNQLVAVTANSFPRYHCGQVIQIQGKLRTFSFPDGKKIFTMYHPKISLQEDSSNPIAAVANTIRLRTRALYTSILPPVPSSLLMGMVFGANEKFPDDFRKALQATGVLHVIAASGMNVTFVSSALLFLLGLFMRRRVALVFGCMGIIFYVFLVGFQPSILRASIMGILAFGASLLGRQNIGIVALLISGYGLLIWQPIFLADVGFQLSFLATLGIMLLKPVLDQPLRMFGKIGEGLGESVTTTTAAQLGTLPVLLSVFGQVGVLSILVNALVLWTIPFIMVFGSLAAIAGLFIPQVGQLFLYPAYPFLVFFEMIVSFFGKSNLVISGVALPTAVWVGYYLLLAAVVVLQRRRERLCSRS